MLSPAGELALAAVSHLPYLAGPFITNTIHPRLTMAPGDDIGSYERNHPGRRNRL